MTTDPIVIVGSARTAIGRFGGAFVRTPAHELGAAAIQAALARAGVAPAEVDEVVMGQVGQVGPDAYNARRCALAAGLPVTSTAQTVNRLCSSGMQAIWTAAQILQTGHAGVVVAGGDENMSMQPFLDFSARDGQALGHRTLLDGTLSLLTDPFGRYQMGCTAEIVAERHGISRADQDAFALESQRRAAAAIEAGRFRDEIVPVMVRKGKEQVEITLDEHPRPNSTLEALTKLKPAFNENGTVTAGNASGINDAGAALVLMRESEAARRGLAPVLRFVDCAVAGVAPEVMGIGPAPAVHKVLDRQGLRIEDMDLIELNEAFAAQALAVIRETRMDPARVNVNGGAIALGHPIGATGAILAIKMQHELTRRGGRYGLVTMCIGGGQGMAAIFERP
jgi:acetyl-CoA C-acetyltransferase